MSKKRILLLCASILVLGTIIAFACYSFGLKKGSEVVQKKSSVQNDIKNALPTKTDNEWLCVPGEKIGQITNKTTEEDLKRIYGNQNVISAKELIEEGTKEVTITYIYKGTDDEIKVLWEEGQTLKKPSWVWIRNNGSKWATPEGITIGTSLEDLQKINDDIFVFNGFRWDYGGLVTSLSQGKLSKYNGELQITMGMDDYSTLPNKYCGDGVSIFSNDEEIAKYKVEVLEMRIALSEPDKTNMKMDSNLFIHIENDNKYVIWKSSKKDVDSTVDIDINNDEKLETVIIGRNHPNGTRVLIIEGKRGYDLFVCNGRYLKSAFDDFGGLKQGYYIQTSFFDLDKDNQKEVLLAIGNKNTKELGVGIYKYNGKIENNGFIQLGYIEGQSDISVLEDGKINVPYGSQGLFNSYSVVKGKFIKER